MYIKISFIEILKGLENGKYKIDSILIKSPKIHDLTVLSNFTNQLDVLLKNKDSLWVYDSTRYDKGGIKC